MGRIVIPKEYRKILNIEKYEQLEMLQISNGILIRKANKSCAICGETENLIICRKNHICLSCIKIIKTL
ncbi:MAG: hypothetical protein A2Y15_06195 [Clostridiales bacterium GWF2_36_10]|nr:MAG: hypothetical protein A2Y15_06195 [Clostridiales bacterium GWF2_36_10]HAN21893.1 AbrB family transcriptional regulator [Clostridiales bacterium]